MEKEKVLNRIRKLMALADPERGGTSGEVENATKMVSELMAKHNLVMSQVDAHNKEPEINVEEQTAFTFRKWSRWEIELCAAMRYLCDVEPILSKEIALRNGKPGRVLKIKFVGERHDVAIAVEMYNILYDKINSGVKRYRVCADRLSYARGFVYEILSRVKKQKENRDAGTALIFVGRKALATKNFMDTKYNNLRTSYNKRTNGQKTDSYYAGRQDGQRQDLGTTRRLK